MSKPRRTKKPSPKRTRPIRNWSTILAAPAASEGGAGTDGAAPKEGERPTREDVVSRSVQLGYRVIDEYIRQGQRAAKRINDGTFDPGAMAGDMQQLTAQMGRYVSDFASIWFELFRLAGAGAGGQLPFLAGGAANQSAAPQPTAAGPVARGGRVRVEVASVRPVEVALDVTAGPGPGSLVVNELRSVDPKLPALDGVGFAAAPGGERVLRLRVAPDQPPGIYNGLVIDADTGRPAGTLSVRVREE